VSKKLGAIQKGNKRQKYKKTNLYFLQDNFGKDSTTGISSFGHAAYLQRL
jgi:hypothetical protein